MGPKTVKRLAVAAVVLVLGIVSIFLLQRRQVAKLGETNLSKAEKATEAGDLKTAEELYLQHIQVFPDDLDAKLKYAKVLLEESKTPVHLGQATGIYKEILSREPGRQDARRLLTELQAVQGSTKDAQDARDNLEILRTAKPNDGALEYLSGRCFETLKEDAKSVGWYKEAVAHGAPEKFDAYQRMARLLRSNLKQPEQADQVIDEMVKAAPSDYRSYLERGRYRKAAVSPPEVLEPEALKAVVADYQEALKLAPKEGSIYLELAMLAAGRTPPDFEEATRILKQGRDADPDDVSIYRTLAALEMRSGKPEDARKTLEQGIERLPDSLDLRLSLAGDLAARGATDALLEQIEQMKRIGLAPRYVDYFTAYARVNMKDWAGARSILIDKLQPLDLTDYRDLRAGVNDLLSRCYAHLGDPERQRAALASAVNDNPNDPQTRFRWIADLVAQGQVDQAIGEYRKMLDQVPGVRLPLVELLMGKIQRLPETQRDWKEVEDLIALAEKDAPTAPQVILVKAQLLQSQKKPAEAKAVLAAALARDPKDPAAVTLWTASAAMEPNSSTRLKILDEAQAAQGDRFELRFARAKVLAARGGPDVAEALIGLTENMNALPKEQRVLLLQTVAAELAKRNDNAAAVRLISQAASLVPNDLQPRLMLLSLGIQTNDKSVIEQALDEIKRIDGADGNLARSSEVEYKIWQAKTSKDQTEQVKLRSEARIILAELRSRRPDWSLIPLATAKLDEQELELATDENDKKQRQSRLADLYSQAVDMGQRNLGVVRRATELLIASGRATEVNQLWSKVPSLNGDGELSGLDRVMLDNVIRGKDHASALELIRQRVEARPNDFAERVLLVQLLLSEKRFQEAEVELNRAIGLDRTDPNRWIALIQLLVVTKQMEKAEQAARDVEKAVAADKSALIMAQCADLVGQGYQAASNETQRLKWFDEAKKWYEKAQAEKPGDVAMKRVTIEFLLRTNQLSEVEKQLTDVLKRSADFTPADLDWAKRTLALSFVMRSELYHEYPQALKALELFAPPGKVDSKLPESPEDLRTLARVYEAQKIPAYRKQAVAILEKLKNDRVATTEDQFLLARLYYANDEWDKARTEYRRLLDASTQTDTPQKINRRVALLVQYATMLIAHIKPGEDYQEAEEVQGLIDQLKKIQPDAFNVVSLQARLDKRQGKNDEAVARLKAIADQPGLSPALALATADLAENLGETELAQRIFKLNATASSRLQDRLAYVAFLGRQGRIKEAIDVCEPLWTSTPNPSVLVNTVLGALFPAKSEPDPAQIERVAGWVERSIQQNPKSTLFLIALGNIRERQNKYAEAEALYRRSIQLEGGDIIPLNNLAWLRTLQGDKSATPLEFINKAITMRGPLPELLDTRAVVYMTNGDNKRAIEDLENAVAISPSAVKYFHLAQAYLAAGDKPAAKENLTKAETNGLAKGNLHPLEMAVYQQVVSTLK